MMVDANQVWDVDQAITWMKKLAQFKPWFIEEPTAPGENLHTPNIFASLMSLSDDVLGHLAIARAMAPLGILVATGEHCANRILFKQFITSGAIGICQIDACRVGGVNEVLAIILMAAKVLMCHASTNERNALLCYAHHCCPIVLSTEFLFAPMPEV
jgi:L-alanine-DL-glutamate epimerase-like enolase superfamily enzyme